MKNKIKVRVRGCCTGPDGNLHRIKRKCNCTSVIIFARGDNLFSGDIKGWWSIPELATVLGYMIRQFDADRFDIALKLARESLANNETEEEQED